MAKTNKEHIEEWLAQAEEDCNTDPYCEASKAERNAYRKCLELLEHPLVSEGASAALAALECLRTWLTSGPGTDGQLIEGSAAWQELGHPMPPLLAANAATYYRDFDGDSVAPVVRRHRITPELFVVELGQLPFTERSIQGTRQQLAAVASVLESSKVGTSVFYADICVEVRDGYAFVFNAKSRAPQTRLSLASAFALAKQIRNDLSHFAD